MFKIRETGTPEEKAKAVDAVRSELLSMKEKIAVIRDFEVGVNLTDNASAFDLVINSTFDSREDLEAYQVHPDHQAFILFNKAHSEKKVLVDYEV
jgi:hypothetical protein